MINSEAHKDVPKEGRLFLMQLTCTVMHKKSCLKDSSDFGLTHPLFE